MYSEIIFALLIPLGFIGGIIYLIVYLVRRKSDPKAPTFDWRRLGVGAAITFVTPFFIGFASAAIFDKLVNTNAFITMIVMSVIFLIIGMIMARQTVISTGLIIGSIVAIIYAIAINSESISPAVMTVLVGLGLAILIYFAYKKLSEGEVTK